MKAKFDPVGEKLIPIFIDYMCHSKPFQAKAVKTKNKWFARLSPRLQQVTHCLVNFMYQTEQVIPVFLFLFLLCLALFLQYQFPHVTESALEPLVNHCSGSLGFLLTPRNKGMEQGMGGDGSFDKWVNVKAGKFQMEVT